MPSQSTFSPAVCIVNFHHGRGPEIEKWFGVANGSDPAVDNDWSFLPFMALSDGAHTSTEDFSYFTLRRRATEFQPATSLFGISCSRQLDAKELLNKPDDVTRSTVQKSLVVVADSPHTFGMLREKLSVVTRAWFGQKDFTDTEILKRFQESLATTFEDTDDDRDPYLGLSLREFIHEFKHQTLVLFKCCLLQPKMLFFGSRCERLCMIQFALVSLIPGLIRRLEDCADPDMDTYEKSMVPPASLKSSERGSLLAYMGLPIQLFGKGSLFGPYTPLQQLDMLADHGTKSYIVGSTNSLLLQQKDRYSDILINLDEMTIAISSPSLRSALILTTADRRWVDALHQTVTTTWDPENPTRPRTHGYLGSEEFIRLQFEEYLLALLSATKYHQYLYTVPHHRRDLSAFPDIEGDPSLDFGEAWIDMWKRTNNFKLWNRFTDNHLFDMVDPRHPTAGGMTIDDINRRFTQQIQELHLDEKFATSREAINKHLATGSKKVSSAFSSVWADIEAFREAQRNRQLQQETAGTKRLYAALSPPPPLSPDRHEKSSTHATGLFDTSAITSGLRAKAPDMSHAQAAVGTAGQKAGAYFSSWGTWASERRKGWGRSSENSGGGEIGSTNVGGDASEKANPLEVETAKSSMPRAEKKGDAVAGSPAKSPVKSPGRRRTTKESVGVDGIGRLDA